ncbi:hypothetical protein GCM10017673_35980 [Streptosporangium violaceochromogenes]|nr:hypothetical protein GCM10017673_35980 [Streptosporangium violaceochromogenes]
MTEDPLDRLRAEAVRDDYPSMIRLARALYETGLGPREVLYECYGVAFPDEFFVLATKPVLMFDYTYQPWDLAVPPDRGGPEDDETDELEADILARDADLVPLGVCLNMYAGFGGLYLCYRLTELAAGRATVFSIEYDVSPDSPITRRADSLLAALHEHLTANAAWVESERHRTIGHSGGHVDDSDVRVAHKFVADIEELRRRVSSSH